MGIKRWLARKGVPGSTARWAARGYHAMLQANPDATLDEIMWQMTKIRYGREAKSHEQVVLDQINSGQVRGLAHLVVIFLIAEAGFADNTPENQSLFQDVVTEELERHEVPTEAIYQFPS